MRTLQCKKNSKKKFFCPWKIEKNTQKSCSESAQTPFFHSPATTSAHSPKLIFHNMKYRDQTSVLLSVLCGHNGLKQILKWQKQVLICLDIFKTNMDMFRPIMKILLFWELSTFLPTSRLVGVHCARQWVLKEKTSFRCLDQFDQFKTILDRFEHVWTILD